MSAIKIDEPRSRFPHGIVVHLVYNLTRLRDAIEAVTMQLGMPLTQVGLAHVVNFPDICKLDREARGPIELQLPGTNITVWSPAQETKHFSGVSSNNSTTWAPVLESSRSSAPYNSSCVAASHKPECVAPLGTVVTGFLLLVPFLLLWNYWGVPMQKTPKTASKRCAASGCQCGSCPASTTIATREPTTQALGVPPEKEAASQSSPRPRPKREKREETGRPTPSPPWSLEDIFITELFFLAELRKLAPLPDLVESSEDTKVTD